MNEKGTSERNDGNEDVSMDDNENIEVDSDKGSFAEEDWNDPEQNEVPKWTKPDLPMTTGTGKGDRKWTGMRYNRYGDDFLIDEIQPEEIGEKLVNVDELVANEEWQIITVTEHSLQEDHTLPERQIEPRTERDRKKRKTKLRILEWLHNLEADEK